MNFNKDLRWLKKKGDIESKSSIAAGGNMACKYCGGDMEDVTPVADALECVDCKAVFWNHSNEWSEPQPKETP
jgi:hypothetical protein